MSCRTRLIALGSTAAVTFTACTLIVQTDGLTGGSSDAGAADGLAADGKALDALASGDSAPSGLATPIATLGAVAHANGMAQGNHLQWAETSGEWVYFYVDPSSPMSLKTRRSKDFSAWTDGPSLDLPLPHGSEPRDFAVATAPLGTGDVFHLGISLRGGGTDHRHYDARATLAGGSLVFSPPEQLDAITMSGSFPLDPDGPAIAITGDGFVESFTGWDHNPGDPNASANVYVFRSSVADVGATFTPTWDFTFITGVAAACNAKAAVPLGTSDVLHLWEAGESEPDPQNLGFARGSVSTWPAGGTVFTDQAKFDTNDWAVLKVSDIDVHVARRRGDGAFDHRRYDGQTFHDGGKVPGQAFTPGGGLVLVAGARGPTLVGLADDTSVRATVWDGASWGAWSTLAPSGPQRSSLTGSTARSGVKSAIAWAEASGAGVTVVGLELR